MNFFVCNQVAPSPTSLSLPPGWRVQQEERKGKDPDDRPLSSSTVQLHLTPDAPDNLGIMAIGKNDTWRSPYRSTFRARHYLPTWQFLTPARMDAGIQLFENTTVRDISWTLLNDSKVGMISKSLSNPFNITDYWHTAHGHEQT